MADDLDDFLKQAAKRRQQRQQQKANRPTMPPAEPRNAAPPRLKPEVVPTAEISEQPRAFTPTLAGSLSSGLPSSTVSSGVDQADERMTSHLKQVFQHEIGNLRQSDSQTPSKKKSKKKEGRFEEPRLTETPAASMEAQLTAKVSANSLAAQLRDPQSLRMAIIAHEIMKRPWQ